MFSFNTDRLSAQQPVTKWTILPSQSPALVTASRHTLLSSPWYSNGPLQVSDYDMKKSSWMKPKGEKSPTGVPDTKYCTGLGSEGNQVLTYKVGSNDGPKGTDTANQTKRLSTLSEVILVQLQLLDAQKHSLAERPHINSASI